MKILLIGNYPHQRQQSMQRFARMLHTGLEQLGAEVRLIRPEPIIGLIRPRETGLGKWLGYMDRFLVFPLSIRRAMRSADLVHICDHGNAVYVPILAETPHLVTCHDLLGARTALGEVNRNRTSWPGRMLARAMLNGIERAQHVTCVSEAARDDLFRLVPRLPPACTSVIENGLSDIFRPLDGAMARKRLGALGIPPGPFLLHVGGNQWYKNRIGVVKIFAGLRRQPEHETHRLILAGKPWTAELRRFVSEHGLEESVLEHTDLTDEDLRALYSTAQALIFPSLAEGFGWPIIEAQACGCPVFAADRSPLTDVGGDAAVYFDPERPRKAAEIIRRHWSERDELRRRGLANARRFTSARMISQYLQTYERLIDRRRASQATS
jgi:glycosyltransferase involved in cell wall biosynthesis